MANFGGFDVEDDVHVQETPAAEASLGGFVVEDAEQNPRSWEEGDGGSMRLHDGEANEWGGNLRNKGRKVLLRRDKSGKVNGYSTTSSMPVKDADGKIAIIPTVVDGNELTPDEAVNHYAETGEHWGKAADDKTANEMAQSLHNKHMGDNKKSWNDYIQSHWDDMSDDVKNDPGTRYQHKRRTGEEVSMMERLANNDLDDAVKEWKSGNDYEEVTDKMGLPIGRQKISRADRSDEDALVALAKDAGIDDWQIERIKKGSKSPEEMRKNLAYVAGNRVSMESADGKKAGNKLTNYIRSASGAVAHAIADRVPDVTRFAGTVLGGERDVEQPVMVDDQYSRKENEDVRKWARRKGIHLNQKNFDSWNEFFKWEAPIEGKEGMKESRSLVAPGNNAKNWDAKSFGDKLVAIADQEQADLERVVPRHLTGNAVMNFVEDTGSTIGGFMFAGPLMVPMVGANSYQNVREEAIRSGKSEGSARGIAAGMAAFDTAMTAAFYKAPVRKWMKAKGFAPVETFKSGSYTDMRRSFGNYFAKQTVMAQSAAALEAGAIMGVQGAGDRLGEMIAKGEDVDLGEIAITGVKGAAEGVAIGLVMGGAHIIGARRAGTSHYDKILRDAIKTPEGVVAVSRINPEGTAAFCEAYERGSVANKVDVDKAGLPPMSMQERGNYYRTLRSLGITADSIRKTTKIGGTAPEAPVSGSGVTPSPEVPPSAALAERIRGMGEEPVQFRIPKDDSGKPKFAMMAWRDNGSGKEGQNRIAIDENAQVAIMDNGDGTFTSYDNLQNAVDSDSIEDAIENANELALAQQYNGIERQKKLQVIRNEHASNFGNKNVMAFPTMADAINQIGAAIRNGSPILGVNSVESLTNPANGFRSDRSAFHTPDGSTVVILDNIDSPADVKRILSHEFVGHGGPNSEFGDGVDDFLNSLDSKEYADRRRRLVDQGMSEEEVDSPRGKREIFANMLQERSHNPSINQRIVSWLNNRGRKIGAKKTYSDADVEVMASRWEKDARGVDGGLDLRDSGDRFEFIELDEEPRQEAHENAPVGSPSEKGTTSRPSETRENADSQKPKELPTDNMGVPIGNVGDSIELENGITATLVTRKDGSKMWKVTRGKRWTTTTDYGKTWHDGLKPGDRFTDDEYESDKVPANVYFGHQKNESGIWEVDFIRKDGSYELKPVPVSDENAHVSASSEKGTTSRPSETAQPTVKEEAKSAPFKPVNERNLVEKLTDKAEAQEIPLAEVEVSDSRIPQFKEGADPVTGEVEPLTGEPYDLVSNPIVVMELKDGKKVVVTGRHRFGLYKRSGRKTIAARVIREADGWSVHDAMAIDAIGNIIDEKGTEKDYVKYFDEVEPTHAEAKAAGFLDRPKGQRAFSIYEGATPDTKQLIDWEGAGGDGKISVDQAGIISSAAPKDGNQRFAAVQRILAQKAIGGLRGKKLGILARSLAEEVKNRKDAPKVSGEMQLDLFTSEEDMAFLAMEDKRADYRVKKSGEYNRVAEVLRTAVSKGGKLDLNGEYANELGITDPKDRNQLISARDKAIERANYWENAVVLDSADKRAMDEEINSKSGAEASKREEIQKKADEAIAAVKELRSGKKPVDTKEAEKSAKPDKNPASKAETPDRKDEKPAKVDSPEVTFTKHTVGFERGANGETVVTSEPVVSKTETNTPAKNLSNTEVREKIVSAVKEGETITIGELIDRTGLDISQIRHARVVDRMQGGELNSWEFGFGMSGDNYREEKIKRPAKDVATTEEKSAVGKPEDVESSITETAKKSLEVAQSEPKTKMKSEAEETKAQKLEDDLAALFDSPEFSPEKQGHLSGDTSRNQNPAGNEYGKKWKIFKPGKRNVDIGAGRFDKATQFFREIGMENLPFDPVNRSAAVNERTVNAVKASRADTATVHNVLNVIDNDNVVDGIINQAARAIKPNGTAIFTVYEGDKSGKGRETRDGWQRNERTSGYVPRVKKFFGHVEVHGGVILAKMPKDKGPAFWAFESTFKNGVYFDTPEFDPAVFQKRVGILAELAKTYVDNGVGTFDTLAERMHARFADKFDSMKTYLRGIWNAVAEQLDLPEVTREQASRIYDTIEKAKEHDNGQTRTSSNENGPVLDAKSSADLSEPAEGESSGRSPRADGNVEPVSGLRDGGERHAEGMPLVGHDVVGAVERVSEANGERGRGNPKESAVSAQDAAAVAGGGSSGTGESQTGLDAGISDGVRKSGDVAKAVHSVSPEHPTNYVITAEDEHWLNTSSPSEKVANNMAVIKLLANLAEEGRVPTPEERTMMSRYVGFGGFPQIVDQKYKDAYKNYGDIPSSELPVQTQASLKNLKFGIKGFDIYREMRQYLAQEEFDAVRQAMISAFYTPMDVCRATHEAFKAAGFNGGRMLETSAGVGNMIGTGKYDSAPHWTAVELDKTTGKILEFLYPEANVKIQGFQDVIIPHNFIDAVDTNVPFSNDIHPYDPEYAKYNFNLHDYFFAKTTDVLRPGGVAALISSTGTLDKLNKELLRFMEEHGGQIVGALRLPNGHQSKNSGTEVAADLIFIQKVNGKADNSAFMKNGEMFGVRINDYFVNHPEMIFGTPEAGHSMYGNAPAIKIKATREPSEIASAILKAAEGLKYLAPNEASPSAPLDMDADRTGLRRGNIGVVDGRIVKREGDVIVPVDVKRWTEPSNGHKALWPTALTKNGVTFEKAVHDLMRLRDAYHEYVEAQKTTDDEKVALKRASLNAVYDVMVSKYKHLNNGPIAKVFDLDDADGIILQNLESYDVVPDGLTATGKPKFKKTNFRKSDALRKRTLFMAAKADRADNTLDGLRISLNESGTVNLNRIAELTGKKSEEVSAELMASGHVFQNPSTGGLEMRDEYLSGAVRRKLREARAAAEVDPAFKKNIEELEKVQPADKLATQIKYQLGQKFIPNETYQQFLSERIFGTPEAPAGKVTVGYDEKKDTWVLDGSITNPFWSRKCPEGTDIFDVLKRIFNGSSLTIKDRVDDGGGKYHYVPNPQKTQAVETMRDDLTAELSKWMVATPERCKKIERSYNDKMNDNVERKFDTSLLTLDGISDEWAKRVETPGYEHQKRVITRGVFGGSLYIQHCVGAGKSFEMFSICMQLRRLGLARKPMLTVPNHMVESGQVLKEFKEAYPGAKILVATTKDLNSTNRRKFLAKAANGDWDCIVVPHSSFSMIGMDPKVQAEYIQQEIDDLREMMESMDSEGKKKGNIEKKIEKKIGSKMEKIKKLLDLSKKDSTVPFENIGVDYLFVDEAHNFKGLDISTKMSNVSGVTGSVSQRAQDLEMKCRYLAKLHGGDKGIIFASGTPISNTISESYTNERFMRPSMMRAMGIYRFDDWAKSFGVVETKAAPRASGKGYQEKTRFSRFQNLIELKQLNFSYSDIVLDSDLKIPRPTMAGVDSEGKEVIGKPIVHKIPATDFQKKYVEDLDKRLDSFKGGYDPRIDNPLKVVTEGRLLAIDPALLGLKDEHRRLETIADNVYKAWKESTGITGKDGETVLDGTQLVFCDSGVPKPKKFSNVVRTADGGFATKSGNVWSFYVSAVNANGMRHAKATRSDGATFSPKPFADHSVKDVEDISSVYAAFDEMAQRASVYNKDHSPASRKHAQDPVGELFDINSWIDENADIVGYDVRFENPYADERSEVMEFDDIEEVAEEEVADAEEDEDAPEKDEDEANNGDAAVENMLRGKFNIYSYLKRALVKRGIPAEEIVFIHDAEDAKSKRAMFEKFNAEGTAFRGGPRILIGNTPKMGEGANVQKRLVAIHHADVPWKPAWLTQRDGRGIRAGNLNGTIAIHRYVTENTFDVYSYDKVSGKQQFINQVQSHDMTDEAEDIDDAVLSAEEAKAAAAGPIGKFMIAKTKLEKEIRKAELTLANQQSDIYNAQTGLEWDERKLQDAMKKLDTDKAMLDKFAAAKGDQPFGIEVIDNSYPEFGKTLTDNDELQQFLMKKINEFVRKGAEDGIVGKLYGMPIWWKELRGGDGRGGQLGRLVIGSINMEKTPAIPIINRVAPIAKSTVSMFKAAVTQATSDKVLDEDRAKVASAQKGFEVSKDALMKLKVDDTLPTKIEDMEVELAMTMNILGAKDAALQKIAQSILNKRIQEGNNAEAAAATLAELNRTNPVDRQLADAEKEAQKVEFDSPEFNPDADKPPETEKDKSFGFTNDEVAFALKAAGMEAPKHTVKADELLERQADALLSNRDYMRKLDHAVYQKNRATRDYENLALGIYTEQCKVALNAAKEAHDEMTKILEGLPADTEVETVDTLKKSVKELKVQLIGAQHDFREAAGAKIGGASEQGRALRSNRILVDGGDYSYAGIRGEIESELGGRSVTPEMDAEIGKLSESFKDLDEKSRKLAVERLKTFSEKIVEDLKRGGKERSSGQKAAGNEMKRVMKNYDDAMTQVQVHADEAGGTLIGLADQLHPSWGKWLKAIGEYHCYLNPDISEQEVIDAIQEDLKRYLEDGIDETTVRDILTGFGHNYRQSRYDSQRKMNDLKSQALSKRQRDFMLENGKLPPQTGMVRDDPSADTRAIRKEVQELKKDIDEQEGGPRALKGALSSAKTRLRNSIADLERAIASGEKIERSHRTLMEDAELQMLAKRRDELRTQYDEMFGEKATLTDEQRRQRAEKSLQKVLERALERLGRAYGGDFATAPRASRIDSPTIQALRDEIAGTNKAIRDLNDAAYPDGTPEEIARKNARRMDAREQAIQRMQARIISGDIRPMVKKAPAMPKDMQERYDAMGKELKRAHEKLRQLRQEAKDSLKPTWLRKVGEAWRFLDGIQKMTMASLDLTQVGNQTGSILMSHPVLAYKSFVQSASTFLNETNAENLESELLSDPLIKEAVIDNKWLLWKKAGEFAENRGDRVEFFDAIDRGFKIGGRVLKLTDIPVYGRAIANSDRLYASYINTAAANLYSLIVKDTGLFPKGASSFEKRVVAEMVNVMAGSGTISKHTRAVLGKVMWAPGLVDSQFKRSIAYTMWHPFTADASEDGSGTGSERAKLSYIGTKEFVRSHIGAMLLGGMMLALFGTDDDKFRFWKGSLAEKLITLMSPRVGNNTLDFTGGEASFYRLFNKLATGVKETGSGRHTPVRDYFGEVARFMQGRINPLVGNILAASAGKDYAGMDYGALEVLGSFAPISIKDAAESIYENGIQDGNYAAAVTCASFVMLGIGKGAYRKDEYLMQSNRFREDYKGMTDVIGDPLLTDADKKDMIESMIKANRLLKPENAGVVLGAVKKVDSEERKIKKAEEQLSIMEKKDGKEDAKIRYDLEKARKSLDAAKQEVLKMIRTRR